MTVVPERFDFRTAGGLRLAADRWAAAGGEAQVPVVLLHGGGQTRHSWERTAQRLAQDGHTAIAYDARGHGESEWDPAGDYSLDAFVGDLLVLAADLERPPVLVGASLGGITSLAALGEHPEVAAGLVLVDVVVALERAGVERIGQFMRAHGDGFADLDEVADAIAAYNPVRRRPRNLDGLRKNVRRRDDGRWYWHWDPAFMEISDEPQRHFPPERLRAAARRVTVPTLVVHGRRSDVVSDAGVADMLELIPGARAAEVSQAGHMVAGDDNDVFADALQEFLQRVG